MMFRGVLKAATILLMLPIIAKASCPCHLTEFGLVKCNSLSVKNFPDGFLNGCKSYNANGIVGLDLDYQEIAELKDNSFTLFEGLVALSISRTNLETIKSKAFNGLTKLNLLVLSDNNVSYIEPGSFDSLKAVKKIILRGNQYLSSLTTRSWTFCHLLTYGNLTVIANNITIFQDYLEDSEYGEAYCSRQQIQNTQVTTECIENDMYLDCSSNDLLDYQTLSCQLAVKNDDRFKSILVAFPKDINSMVQDIPLSHHEAFDFFKNLASNETMNQNRRVLNVTTIKFDLADLPKNTMDGRTERVVIRADTVVISKPVIISYRLEIVARLVVIDHSLTMHIPITKFKRQKYVTKFEKHFKFKDNLIRQRKFGLIEIVDEAPKFFDDSKNCQPVQVVAMANNTDAKWFDETLASFVYLYANTIFESENSGRQLAVEMAKFYTNFYNDKSIVKSDRAFSAANRLSRLQLAGQEKGIIRNVPFYTLTTIKELSSTMHDKLKAYQETEIRQEEQLETLRAQLQDIEVTFLGMDLQIENFMHLEKQQLDALFTESSEASIFNYDHRQETSNKLSSEMERNRNATITMSAINMNVLGEEAENSLEHYENVKVKYGQEVERLQQKSDSEAELIKALNEKFKVALSSLDHEGKEFERAIEEYKEEQAAKAVFGIFKAIVSIATGDLDAIDDIGDILELVEQIIDVVEKIDALLSLVQLSSTDPGAEDLSMLTAEPSPHFLDTLQQSTKLKMTGPLFDELRRNAEIKIEQLNVQTDNEIDGIEDLKAALAEVSDLGNRLIAATGEYADTTLELVNKKGDVSLANNDIQRATDQLEVIKQSKNEMITAADSYNQDVEQIKKKYEDDSKILINGYKNAADNRKHEYMEQINQRYDNLMVSYSGIKKRYLDSLDQMTEALEDKRYGLKLATITQRSMMFTLFNGYCQALFYNTFSECNERDVPLLGDDMDVLLDKLLNLQWDAALSTISVNPQPFFKEFMIEDSSSRNLQPIYNLKKNSKVSINFKDWLDPYLVEDSWRQRIRKIGVFLLDSNENVIRNDNGQIRIQIIFPVVFKDKDQDRVSHTFLAQHFACLSSYSSGEDGSRVICTVAEEFSSNNYKPSPDGIFDIKLLNDEEELRRENIAKLKIELEGTLIHIPTYGL